MHCLLLTKDTVHYPTYYEYFNPTFWESLVVFVPVTANLIINYFRGFCSVDEIQETEQRCGMTNEVR